MSDLKNALRYLVRATLKYGALEYGARSYQASCHGNLPDKFHNTSMFVAHTYPPALFLSRISLRPWGLAHGPLVSVFPRTLLAWVMSKDHGFDIMQKVRP